jgi:hypothetical protein
MKSKTQLQKEKIDAIYNSLRFTGVDYATLKKCLDNFLQAEKNVYRTHFLTSKHDCTVKQKIRHELNCEDLFIKSEVLQLVIDDLSKYQAL